MVDLLCSELGAVSAKLCHMGLQVCAMDWWRLGNSFLKDGMLWVGGDWCHGAKVQDAWRSGVDIAANVLHTFDTSLSAKA